MPKIQKFDKTNNNMRQLDINTLERINVAGRISELLRKFFDKGFRGFDAFKSIVVNYYPDVDEKRLQDFWHFRNINSDLCNIVEDVLEKLKQE